MKKETEIIITTGRLILRPWREDDAADLYRYASDGRVSKPAMWPRHTSLQMSLDVIRNVFMPYADTFAMTLAGTGEAIGCIGLVPEGCENYPTLPGEREVGYWIGHPFWGKGLTPEALSALIDYCRNILGLNSLIITTNAHNSASQRVAEKCGFVFIEDYTTDGMPGKAYRLVLSNIS